MKRSLFLLAVLGLAATSVWGGPSERTGIRGWGPRLGVSGGPGQAIAGVHFDLGDFAERFRLQPNVEVSVGDNQTTLSFNGDFAYRFAVDWGMWSPYLGGGLGLNARSTGRGWSHGGSDASLGASFIGGMEKALLGGDRFFMETKIGLVDSPDLKFEVGWTFF